MKDLDNIDVQSDEVRWVERIQSSCIRNAKVIECRQCSSAHCFLRHSVQSFRFQPVWTASLTSNDNAELVLLNACARSLSAACDEFKRLHPKVKRFAPSHFEETEDQSCGNGFRWSQASFSELPSTACLVKNILVGICKNQKSGSCSNERSYACGWINTCYYFK